MKKLSLLLQHRESLLRETQLANLAFAFTTLRDFAHRIARGGLVGRVHLTHAAPDADRYWAALTAVDGNQSVIEEHFADEEVMDLADVLAFVTGSETLDVTFALEDVAAQYLAPLRDRLAHEGVDIDLAGAPTDALR